MTSKPQNPADLPLRDSLYAQPRASVEPFRFDDSVVRVFPDMIRRSVPGYATMVEMTGVIAGRYARPDSTLYDLGCSLGAVTLAMRHRLAQPDCHQVRRGVRIVAIDNSSAMLARARELLAADAAGITRPERNETETTALADAGQSAQVPVELRCEDIRDTVFVNASVVALNFTLQFINPADRLPLLTRIAAGLLPGGALVLAEKIRFADAQEQQRNDTLHHDFKRAQGYSDMEIAQKRTALENVLLAETLDEHVARLQAAGFTEITPWFRCFNFVSIIARTPDVAAPGHAGQRA